MNNKIRLIFALLIMTVSIFYGGLSVSADTSDEIKDGEYSEGANYQTYSSGIPFRVGGTNSIDGVTTSSKEETEELEEKIRKENYILINTDDKEISDEEFELFVNSEQASPPYPQYLSPDNMYYWTFIKVYVYRPIYNECMKQMKNQGFIESDLRFELITSTVVINYSYWRSKERAGSLVNEFNDNIPDWTGDAYGFMQITSSINVEIIIKNEWEKTYNRVIAKANTPLLLKVPEGVYVIKKINGTEIDNEEETLPVYNYINIIKEYTQDLPYEIDLKYTLDKYAIDEITLDEDTPNYSWENTEELKKDSTQYQKVYEQIPEYMVTVEEETPQVEEIENKSGNKLIYLILGIIIIAAVALKIKLDSIN